MVSILITHGQSHLLNAAAGLKKLPGFFKPDVDQVANGGVSRFAFKYFGDIKGAQIHIFRNLV